MFLEFSEALKRPEDIKFYNISIDKINEDPEKMLNITFFPNDESYAEDIEFDELPELTNF